MIQLEESWLEKLGNEFEKTYFKNLKNFLIIEKKNKIIYPSGNKIFAAMNLCSFDNTKVVILGQDPYHGTNQANGLCFSVNDGIPQPPSLQNIFKELSDDLKISVPQNGDLTKWAKQGVLLLNATLTVEKDKAGSHQNKGWEQFTDTIIESLNLYKKNLVYILWGNYAQAKAKNINSENNLILKAVHPSPLAANRGGFFGCRHFSKCNEYLVQNQILPIDWSL